MQYVVKGLPMSFCSILMRSSPFEVIVGDLHADQLVERHLFGEQVGYATGRHLRASVSFSESALSSKPSKKLQPVCNTSQQSPMAGLLWAAAAGTATPKEAHDRHCRNPCLTPSQRIPPAAGGVWLSAISCRASSRSSSRSWRARYLVLKPTGGGKSLCYQIRRCCPGSGVVVSPLISLMKDQVDTLRANSVAAVYINSA